MSVSFHGQEVKGLQGLFELPYSSVVPFAMAQTGGLSLVWGRSSGLCTGILLLGSYVIYPGLATQWIQLVIILASGTAETRPDSSAE